jgi:hypothetical protein
VVQPSAGSVGGGEATNSVADAGDAEAVDMGKDKNLMGYFGVGAPAGEAGTSDAASADVESHEADAAAAYLTPAMRAMLLRSRQAREASAEQQQQPKAAEEAGSSGSKEVAEAEQ